MQRHVPGPRLGRKASRAPGDLRKVPRHGYLMLRMAFRARLPLVPLAMFALAGCHGCHDDHPYVPYSVGSAQTTSDAPGDASVAAGPTVTASPDGGSGPFSGQPATVAPPGLVSWALDGVTLQAPAGRVFALAVVRDFDGDGAKDAFAIVRPPDGNDMGEVVFYRGPALALTTFVPPVGLAFDPTCSPIARLAMVGPRSVFLELGEQCPRGSTSSSRWVAVIGTGPAQGNGSARVRLAATVADPAGAPALTIDADGADRDGDGIDDVALRVSLEGGGPPLEPGPRVSVTLAWLDRFAGLSRDGAVTEASFASLAAAATSRAARSADAAAVPAFVGQVRTLWRATCAEGGAPRLVGMVGAGAVICGGGRALGDLGLAEVRAYATLGDPLRAALALDRAERPPALHSPAHAADAEKWIAHLAPVAMARSVRAVAAVPLAPRGHEPSWGPLAFETEGKLLVRTAVGVVRVDPDQGDEAAAQGVDWKPGVVSPDGSTRWIEAYDPCDGLSLRATFALASGDDVREVALAVQPPLSGRCAGSRGALARTIPVAWGPGGLEAIVEGEPVLVSPDLSGSSALAAFMNQPSTRGGPRSPDEKTYVVATSAGLLVRGPAGARLFHARELDGTYGDERDCAVSDDGVHVACVRAGKAWVGTWSR